MDFKKIYCLVIILSLFTFENANSTENKILVKVNNEIITSIDVVNEAKYLKALNPEIKKLNKDKILEISKNSIIREKIKKIEILKRVKNTSIEEEYLDKLLYRTYSKLGLKTKEGFINHLNKYDVNIDTVRDKISIEAFWNELIYYKFSKKVKINKAELKKEILKNNASKNISFLLYEITFNEKNKENIKKKYNLIKKDIENKGFENSALIHSTSETSTLGGKLGWIKKNSLSKKIKDELKKVNIGEITNPITVPGGFLILKIKDKKKVNQEIDMEKELNNLIKYKTNIQLNQYSNIYFNKIKNNITINET